MVGSKWVAVYAILSLFSPVVSNQDAWKHLELSFSAGTGVAEEFVMPRGQVRKIFYPGEEIRVRISLYNHMEEEVWVNLPETKITQHFAIEWVEVPDKRLRARPSLQLGKVYKGGDIQPSAEIENVIKLGPREMITTEGTFPARNMSVLVPGEYEIKVTYVVPPEIEQQLRRLGQRIVVHEQSFRFEFRKPTTVEDQLEIMHRAAVLHYLSKNYEEAIAKVKQLLAVYPNSSAAYTLLGNISFEKGDYLQAIKHDEKAIELLESGADVIRLRFRAADHNKDHLTGFLKGRIQASRERLQRR
ncbi:MAG: tetratricopeptide repeat protein [Acidobacteriota bacterium]|nr:tetratricopeptide repeat protein [Blastocatellia bacterium]MDW8239195.1 tetratricopeptide repeat protein [Acidobacteriota bacterium]